MTCQEIDFQNLATELLNFGANLNDVDFEGHSALHFCSLYGTNETAKVLVSYFELLWNCLAQKPFLRNNNFVVGTPPPDLLYIAYLLLLRNTSSRSAASMVSQVSRSLAGQDLSEVWPATWAVHGVILSCMVVTAWVFWRCMYNLQCSTIRSLNRSLVNFYLIRGLCCWNSNRVSKKDRKDQFE